MAQSHSTSLGTHSIRDGRSCSALPWNTIPLVLDVAKKDSAWTVCVFVQASIYVDACGNQTHKCVDILFSTLLAVSVSWTADAVESLGLELILF